MSTAVVATAAGADGAEETAADAPSPALSKSAQKKQRKMAFMAEKKAARKAAEKARHRENLDRRRSEWEAKLAAAPSEEARAALLQSQKAVRENRRAAGEKEHSERVERLRRAADGGTKIVIDLEFDGLMRANEIHSLMQQIMYCYSVNKKSPTPAHLWLTGCGGDLAPYIKKISGINNWIIEKENGPYVEVFQECKSSLVYLTADAESTLDDLDPSKIYIIGGLVDRNRHKGITLKKANDQGIQAAKLPIGNFLKMSSSQVLTVNHVFAIMIKYMETKDWCTAFFHVIPQRKREADGDTDAAEASIVGDAADDGTNIDDPREEDEEKCEEDDHASKRQCLRDTENEELPDDCAAAAEE